MSNVRSMRASKLVKGDTFQFPGDVCHMYKMVGEDEANPDQILVRVIAHRILDNGQDDVWHATHSDVTTCYIGSPVKKMEFDIRTADRRVLLQNVHQKLIYVHSRSSGLQQRHLNECIEALEIIMG